MQYLQLHMDPCFHVDATCEPPLLARKVHRLLGARAFRVAAAAWEGMEHLQSPRQPMAPSAAKTFAAALPLP